MKFLKKKKKKKIIIKWLNFIGLDKITAKTTEIKIKFRRNKKIWSFRN